jgi:LemA protein
MKKSNVLILIILVLLFLVIGVWSWYKNCYDTIVKLDEAVKASWAQVENQLQRRYDLVPNLVSTVKGYAQHEEKVLTEVTNARAKVGSASSVKEKIDANSELSSALSRLLMVVENYPQLKANENFRDLQAQLEGTENRIATERRRYNEAVREYNQYIRGFFKRFVAKSMNLSVREPFEADMAAKKAPEVKF